MGTHAFTVPSPEQPISSQISTRHCGLRKHLGPLCVFRNVFGRIPAIQWNNRTSQEIDPDTDPSSPPAAPAVAWRMGVASPCTVALEPREEVLRHLASAEPVPDAPPPQPDPPTETGADARDSEAGDD